MWSVWYVHWYLMCCFSSLFTGVVRDGCVVSLYVRVVISMVCMGCVMYRRHSSKLVISGGD